MEEREKVAQIRTIEFVEEEKNFLGFHRHRCSRGSREEESSRSVVLCNANTHTHPHKIQAKENAMAWHTKSYRAKWSKQKSTCIKTFAHQQWNTYIFIPSSAKFLSIQNGVYWKSGSSKQPTTTTTTTKNTKTKRFKMKMSKSKKSERKKKEHPTHEIRMYNVHELQTDGERQNFNERTKTALLLLQLLLCVLADDETMIKL